MLFPQFSLSSTSHGLGILFWYRKKGDLPQGLTPAVHAQGKVLLYRNEGPRASSPSRQLTAKDPPVGISRGHQGFSEKRKPLPVVVVFSFGLFKANHGIIGLSLSSPVLVVSL